MKEFFAKHEKVVGGVAVAVILIAVIYLVTPWTSGASVVDLGSGYFLTTDDGASYINGSADDISPVELNGKTAYSAHLGKQQSDGKIKVFYMHRFTPQAHEVLVKMKAGEALDDKAMSVLATGKQFKKPGDKDWKTFRSANDSAAWVRSLVGADGKQPIGLN